MPNSFNLNYNPKLKQRARELRKNSTLSEIILWEKLKGRQILNYKFRRQISVLNFIIDFYCKELKLGIEIDGFSHDFKIDYDIVRQKNLENIGVALLRFSDGEVKKDIQNVLQRIYDWIENKIANGQPTPTPPKRGMTDGSFPKL